MAKPKETGICLKYFETIVLSLAFLSLGLCISVAGPTLPTLAYNLDVDVEEISLIFPSRGGGYLLGSILSGILYEKLNQYGVTFATLLMTSIGIFFVPLMPYISLLAVGMATTGFSMGVLDTGGNVMCLQTWGDKSEPYMQVLHFSFAFGASLAPLFAKPFIRSEMNVANEVVTPSANQSTTTHLMEEESTFPDVMWVFVIVAAFTLVCSISFLCLFCCVKKSDIKSQENTIKSEGSKFRLQLLALLFIFFMFYVGMEVAFGAYIYTFARNCSNRYSKDVSTFLNTLFWGSFTAGRFLSIFLTKILSSTGLLRLDLLGTFTSVILLCIFPLYADNADFLLWVAVSMYGLAIASIFPTGISWAEQYITINGRAATALVVGAALGEMILPFILGHFINANPMNLMYFTVGTMVMCVLTYIAMQVLASGRGKRLKQGENIKKEVNMNENGEESHPLMEVST